MVRGKEMLNRVRGLINYKVPRGEFNLDYRDRRKDFKGFDPDYGRGLRIEDVPTGRWTRGYDTVISTVVNGQTTERHRIPTQGIVNRLVHGRRRAGSFLGPIYRSQAELEVGLAVGKTIRGIESSRTLFDRHIIGMVILTDLVRYGVTEQKTQRRNRNQ